MNLHIRTEEEESNAGQLTGKLRLCKILKASHVHTPKGSQGGQTIQATGHTEGNNYKHKEKYRENEELCSRRFMS